MNMHTNINISTLFDSRVTWIRQQRRRNCKNLSLSSHMKEKKKQKKRERVRNRVNVGMKSTRAQFHPFRQMVWSSQPYSNRVQYWNLILNLHEFVKMKQYRCFSNSGSTYRALISELLLCVISYILVKIWFTL